MVDVLSSFPATLIDLVIDLQEDATTVFTTLDLVSTSSQLASIRPDAEPTDKCFSASICHENRGMVQTVPCNGSNVLIILLAVSTIQNAFFAIGLTT